MIRLTLFLSSFITLYASDWKHVNLASFPRSGNHWVRFLTEEATHIATSSSYRDGDYPHLKEMFPWKGYCTKNGYRGNCRYPELSDPILIKTHFPWLAKKPFDRQDKPTICLIRHPVDSIYSYFVYMKKNNPKRMPKKIDLSYVLLMSRGWNMFYEYWEKQKDVLIIRYEDLHDNTKENLTSILTKAGFTFSEEDIERAVKTYPPFGEPLKHLSKYSNEQKMIIRQMCNTIMKKYDYHL